MAPAEGTKTKAEIMKKAIILFILLTLMTVVIPAHAQGEFYIESDAEPLDAGILMEAAQPLLDRGAIVAIYFAESGESEEFDRRLRDDDLMRGNLLEDNLIAIFVSLGDRHSEILYGDRWKAILDPRTEGIKSSALDGNLREGVYTRAFERTLQEIETVIADPNAPPPLPPRRITPPDSSSDSSFNWAILIFLGLGVYSLLVKLGIINPQGYDDGAGPVSAPRYKSSWSSGHRPRSSGRSSISRSSGRSFGGGGRRGGKW